MKRYLTLADENRFRFVCPIFNAETSMRACGELRERVWAGKETEVRKGCQACMTASKCPAAEVIRRIMYSKTDVPDDHASLTPVVGKLKKPILEKIAVVMVREQDLARFDVPAAERELIRTANERIYKQLGSAPPSGDGEYEAPASTGSTSRRKRAAPKRTPASDNINKAAATGDMAAAVSAA